MCNLKIIFFGVSRAKGQFVTTSLFNPRGSIKSVKTSNFSLNHQPRGLILARWVLNSPPSVSILAYF